MKVILAVAPARVVAARAAGVCGGATAQKMGLSMNKICTCYIGRACTPAARWLIMIFWVLAAIFGGIFGLPGFLSATSLTFSPTPGTPSSDAAIAFQNEFPDSNNGQTILVYARSMDGSPLVPEPASWDQGCYLASGPDNKTYVEGPLLKLFLELNQTVSAYSYPEIVSSFTSFCSIADLYRTKPILSQIMQTLAGALLSKDRSTTYMLINLKLPTNPTAAMAAVANANISAFATYLQQNLPPVEAQFPGIDMKLTGLPVFALDVLGGVETQLLSSEGVAFPLALLVLTIMLKSVRLLIIPMMCIVSSLLTSFLIMWPVALTFNVIQFCPSVMSSVTLALSIDYSLFLLSRFREEVGSRRPLNPQAVVINMMQYAGHTVLVSGCIICLCFLALLAFPVELLASVGIGSSICIAVTILCNCTLTPAMLLTFYPFFGDFHTYGFACWCCRKSCLKRGNCSRHKGQTDAKATTVVVVVAGDANDGFGFGTGDDDEPSSQLTEVLMPANGELIDATAGLRVDGEHDEDFGIEYDRGTCW